MGITITNVCYVLESVYPEGLTACEISDELQRKGFSCNPGNVRSIRNYEIANYGSAYIWKWSFLHPHQYRVHRFARREKFENLFKDIFPAK